MYCNITRVSLAVKEDGKLDLCKKTVTTRYIWINSIATENSSDHQQVQTERNIIGNSTAPCQRNSKRAAAFLKKRKRCAARSGPWAKRAYEVRSPKIREGHESLE